MPVVTSPKGKLAREIFDTVEKVIGVTQASRWLFSGCDGLGGRSPIEALRAGDEQQVRKCVIDIIIKPEASAA